MSCLKYRPKDEKTSTIRIINPHLQFCREKLNTQRVHIDVVGDLVNCTLAGTHHTTTSFTKYWGTCSIIPLPRVGCLQYWEVITRVRIKQPLTGNNLILEIGLCWEEERDVHYCIARRPHSYVLTVDHCTTHSGICRSVWKDGNNVSDTPLTLPNTADTSATLHYGVVYDDHRKKVVFIDVSEKKVLQVVHNVDSSQPLLPMFGVYNPHLLTANMTLVVGLDISMDEEKIDLITQSLLP